MALKSQQLPTTQWEIVFPDALHSIRSLLCTVTNATPHERLSSYQRRSTSGVSIPSWLATPGIVLIKRHVRHSKYEPLVDEVEHLDTKPQYVHVRLPSGTETTVFVKHLSPCGDTETNTKRLEAPNVIPENIDNVVEECEIVNGGGTVFAEQTIHGDVNDSSQNTSDIPPEGSDTLRRSGPTRRPPIRLDL